MNWKGAVLLVIVVVALGIYLFQTRALPRSAMPFGKTFLGCLAGNAVDLKLVRADGTTVEVQRSSDVDSWSVVKPDAGPAVDATVDGLITELHTLVPNDSLATAAAGTDYGFAAPELTVDCRVASGVSFNLTVGKQSFDGSSRYARLSGDPKVYVLSGAEVDRIGQFLVHPPYRPSPIPSGPSPSPST